MEFPSQEYWSGLPFLSPGDLTNPGMEPRSAALQADSLLSEPPGKPKECLYKNAIFFMSQDHHWLVTATMDVSVIAVPKYLFGFMAGWFSPDFLRKAGGKINCSGNVRKDPCWLICFPFCLNGSHTASTFPLDMTMRLKRPFSMRRARQPTTHK